MKNKGLWLLSIWGIALLGGCTQDNQFQEKREVEEVKQTEEMKNREQIEETGKLSIGEAETQKIQEEAKKVALIYKSIYQNADKGTAYNVVISEEIVRSIKDCLAANDKVVIDDVGHFNMANYQMVEKFCEAACSGEEAKVTIYKLHRDGGYAKLDFHVKDKQMDLMVVGVSWSQSIEPQVTYMEKYKLKQWEYTQKGYLIYERAFSDYIDSSGYTAIRVKPIKEEYLTLCKTYIEPIGYQGNNLFLTNWNTTNMTSVAFNDAFEYLYYLANGEPINTDNYRIGIPKLEFESVLCRYLPITEKELEERAYYDDVNKCYKWEVLGCANYTATPKGYPVPVVVDSIEHEDGSLTLVVDALWEEYGTDCAFTHEVTIVPQADGSFYYVGNRMIDKDNAIIPTYRNRIKGD